MNKNGVLVTKHVRPDIGSTVASGRTIPGPAPVAEPLSEDQHRAELIDGIVGALPGLLPLYVAPLESLQTDTLRAFHSAAQRPEAQRVVTAILQSELGAVMTVTEPFLQLAAHSAHLASVMAENGGRDAGYGMFTYRRIVDAAGEGGFRDYEGSVTEDEVAVCKAYVFASAANIDPTAYRARHYYHRDVQRIADHMAEIEHVLPPVAAALQLSYDYHFWDDVEDAIAASKESGADPQDLAACMLDRESSDIRSAAEALRGVARPLQNGAL